MSSELEERNVPREEAAEHLQKIAGALRTGDTVDMGVNNQTVHLSPADTITHEVGVDEKWPVLRGDREAVTVEVDWGLSYISGETSQRS